MELSNAFMFLVPVVVGVTHVLKGVGISSRYTPLASLILGVVGSYIFVSQDINAISQGIVVGLTASGLWSGVKSTVSANA